MGESPTGGGVGVAQDTEVGEGLQLGDELVVRQGVNRRLGEVRHGPEADGVIIARRCDPPTEGIDRHP